MVRRPRGYLFIVGVGRDGSTLLQALVNSSRKVLVRGENALALEMASALARRNAMEQRYQKSPLRRSVGRAIRRLTRRNVRLSDNRDGHPWFGFHSVLFSRIVRRCRAAIVSDVIRPSFWHSVVGFKEIRWPDFPHAIYGMELLFPDAKYIVIQRRSSQMAKSGWWPHLDDPVQEIERRQSINRQLLDIVGHRGLEVDYQDLISSNSGTRKKIEDFVGVRFSQEKWDHIVRTRLNHSADLAPWDYPELSPQGN